MTKRVFFYCYNVYCTVTRRRSPQGRLGSFMNGAVRRGSNPIENMMNIKNKLVSVLAFAPKAVAAGKAGRETEASKKLEDWLKTSRMRSF